MKFKLIKPRTPTQRGFIKINRNHLVKNFLLKEEIKGSKNRAGRNNQGRITSYHRGGGHKKRYRKLNFHRINNSTGIVMGLEYDPNRTSFIASIFDFSANKYFYIIAPKNLEVGDIIKSGLNAEIKLGHSLPLEKIPVGSLIHNISLKPNTKGKITRAAGAFSKLIKKTTKYCQIRLSSKQNILVSIKCFATIGIVSNEYSFLRKIGKAGRSRWLNRRPIVRGVAMNPVDHPHGGGEGKSSGGKRALTPWGKPTKGGKTRKLNKK